tara:strand:+ start:646 stop:1113 length:468 start_codon:yes stop_codon:yes gene_type:complete
MFCKVCKDAGKTEIEYTSHYVKDKSGKIICPTLLNQACKYCRQKGHTVKFCPTLKLNEKNKKQEEYFKKQHPEWEDELGSAARRLGSSFDSESEYEYETKLDLNEKVPVATHYIRSYASVLVDDSVPQVENVKVVSRPLRVMRDWADEVSSSDEE